MDPLNKKSATALLQLHEQCFDKCINSFGSTKLERAEVNCTKNCFKSFAMAFRDTDKVINNYFSTGPGA